ncbi:MAG: hypothetical protein U9Q40_03440 [Campylobacterota bacterium]|nr:hypothetical protein [Campylobacterota bacterium]
MKKLSLTALLVGAGLFVTMGATSLSAEGMKCGAGKCGKAMEKPAGKCGGDKAAKCGANKKAAKCGDAKKASKCGGEKKAPNKAPKCGAGKCG